MFDIGPFEMIALVVLAILLFGPDKLPKLAADAARMLNQFRAFTQSARADLTRELGPEFQSLNIEDLNPRTFVRKNLLGDDLFDTDFGLGDDVPGPRSSAGLATGNGNGTGGSSSAAGGRGPDRVTDRAQPGELPPYDADAT